MLSKNKIKHLQSLTRKKVRDELQEFVAEGPKVVEELLGAANIALVDLFATSSWLTAHASGKSKAVEIDEKELKQVSSLSAPNQVIAIFRKPAFSEPVNYCGQMSLVLDTIQDPGNLGTIIRCADWFGIQDIICSHTCVDAFNPKVIQSTMGSIARVRVTYTDLEGFLDEQSRGEDSFPVIAAALDGSSLCEVKGVRQGFLLIGNESRGISHDLLGRATKLVTIPRVGQAESLNAAVATGIILSHLQSNDC